MANDIIEVPIKENYERMHFGFILPGGPQDEPDPLPGLKVTSC